MKARFVLLEAFLLIALFSGGDLFSQSSTGSISGTITDQRRDVIAGAAVTVRGVSTGLTRATASDSEGNYRFIELPIGTYEVAVEAPNFLRYLQRNITLAVNQDAVVDAVLSVGQVTAVVTVSENASVLNTTTAEVSTRFDERRLSELPISPTRNVLNVLLSVPGVSQLSTGQAAYATGLSISVNGGRLRSNNFMLDGQDINDPVFAGVQVPLNNPDAIREVQIITNQYAAEYGRNSASVVNVIGKSGTNDYHGSAFWFHNNEYLNACSNLDKIASGEPTGFCSENAVSDARTRAPRRRENQIGFTIGGPLILPRFGDGDDPNLWKGTDRTFFFGDYQRWSNRALVSGPTISSAPSAAGRAMLQSFAPGRPQVQAFLDSVPVGTPNGRSAAFTHLGVTHNVGLSDLTGSAQLVFDDDQGSMRIDHRLNDKHLLYGRYRADSQTTSGTGQVTPPGLTSINFIRTSSALAVLNSALNNRSSNEFRIAWTRFKTGTDAEYPFSKTIPAIQIISLDLVNANALASGERTAIGYPLNLPGGRVVDTYQISDAYTRVKGSHTLKFGGELRRTDARLAIFLNNRGNLTYANLSSLISDVAGGSITFPLRGTDFVMFYRWHEVYAFARDEWRVRDDLTLTFGVRYEHPGDQLNYIKKLNERILAANNNNPAYRVSPLPEPDANNFMPRVGFNWNPRTRSTGILGRITGGDKLVIRGGYSRTYDASFVNIPGNIARAFPFVANQTVTSFTAIRNLTGPNLTFPNRLARTIVAENFRAPATDQLSLEFQRELTKNIVLTAGYIRTRGTGLLQSVNGNPCRPGLSCLPPNFGNRVNPSSEIVTVYANSAASVYDALQINLAKRLSKNISAGLHYTFSTFIDDASDIFAPSASEISVAQNPFDRRSERARSSYDRPHRLTGNFVYEFPFYAKQKGFTGRLLGGWQVNSFFTFQSGAPFSVSLGSDPACAVCGIGTSVRPNLNTGLDLSSMSIVEILAAGGANLFRGLSPGQRVGTAGRNILRSDGIRLVDLGIIKNTQLSENIRVQLRADVFNALNSRNFGIPIGTNISGLNFLNKWATDGGNRRIVLGARLAF